MRSYTLAALCAAVSFVAVPAFAQTTTPANEPAHATGAHNVVNPRQQLMQDLQKAGFTNIRIEPEAFDVHAMNSQGEPVFMQITPDSVEAVTAMKQSGSAGRSHSAANDHSAAGDQSGTKTE